MQKNMSQIIDLLLILVLLDLLNQLHMDTTCRKPFPGQRKVNGLKSKDYYYYETHTEL